MTSSVATSSDSFRSQIYPAGMMTTSPGPSGVALSPSVTTKIPVSPA
jgi:hypothetical protein